jgi:hypothetical protein
MPPEATIKKPTDEGPGRHATADEDQDEDQEQEHVADQIGPGVDRARRPAHAELPDHGDDDEGQVAGQAFAQNRGRHFKRYRRGSVPD